MRSPPKAPQCLSTSSSHLPGGVPIKTVIYLDELLLVNFAASAVFLLGAGLVCGQRCAAWRLVLGAAAGALASLSLLWPELPFALALLYKGTTCAGMVRLAYRWPGARPFLRLCAWVLLLSLALTGVALLPGAGVHSGNLSVYVPLSPGLLLVCCGAVYALLRGLQFCFGRAEAESFDAVLSLGGREIPVRAFYDTGFSVQDAAGGRAVVLVRYEAVRRQLSPALCAYLDAEFSGASPVPSPNLGVRFVPCGTAAGRCLLPAVPAEALTRRAGAKTRRQLGPLVAFAADLPSAEWTVLFGADVAGNLGV